MTFTIHFLPEMEGDVIIGYTWYEEKVIGLGEKFIRMFYACADEILHNPLLYPRVYREFRRRLLRRFPYAIYFKIEDFHCARDPRTIRAQNSKRHSGTEFIGGV